MLKKQSTQQNTTLKDTNETSRKDDVSQQTDWVASSIHSSAKKDPFSPIEKEIIAKKLDRGTVIQSFTPAIEKAFPKQNRDLAVEATNAKRFKFPTAAKSRVEQQPDPMIWAKFGLRKWIKNAPQDYTSEGHTFRAFKSSNSIYRENRFTYSPSTT